MPVLTYREAIRAALSEEIERDPNVVIMGEEVAQFNGAYKVTEGMLEKYGPKRIVDTPISEAGFIGMGIGASMLGIRPVMELMFWSFYSVAFDQIVNNAANVRYMSGGQIACPIVIRGPANGGTNVGATHSHTVENILAHHPGLKVVVPSNAADAKALMKTAIRDNDPVMFLENTILYGEKGEVPEGDITLPFGRANIARAGKDLTIVTYGRCVLHSLAAAETLRASKGFDIEIIDLRTIRPLDVDTILRSVAKTHRLLIVEEQRPYCSIGSHIAAIVQEEAFDELDAPILRVGTIDAPSIYSPPPSTRPRSRSNKSPTWTASSPASFASFEQQSFRAPPTRLNLKLLA